MNNVMIDLETLGNGKDAAICQIGACYFDRLTGEIGETFKVNVDARTAVASGAALDADTVYWWLAQSREAQQSIIGGELVPINEALIRLNHFLANAKYIWSHATFDFVVVTHTYKRLGIKPLFNYKAARDIRTLVDLAKITVSSVVRTGLHHDGLEDAKHQVKYCVEAFRKLENKVK